MRNRIAGVVALPTLAVLVAGCPGPEDKTASNGVPRIAQTAAVPLPAGGATAVKTIYELPACSGDTSDPLGTVNIVLPDKIDGGPIDRKVNSGPKVPKDDPNTGEGNGGGGGNGGFNPNKPASTQPFDVYLQGSSYPGKTGYIMVRVLLTKPAKFAFWESGGIHGVGMNQTSPALLCGAEPAVPGKNPGNGQAESISVFYIDFAVFSAMGTHESVPFTIGLMTGNTGPNAAKTPILIDPKIINDGGGVRLTTGGNTP